ncbi:hypothetical protein BgiBS90_026440, partial [Biomphalaria glabrata]
SLTMWCVLPAESWQSFQNKERYTRVSPREAQTRYSKSNLIKAKGALTTRNRFD